MTPLMLLLETETSVIPVLKLKQTGNQENSLNLPQGRFKVESALDRKLKKEQLKTKKTRYTSMS